jgi:predicted oxidoreductase
MDPAAVAGAFEHLRQAGKVREFGVSNFSPSQFALLQKFCPMPLVVNQVEVHLGRLDCLDDGTLDQCLAETVTPLAWSPLAGGYLATGAKVARKHPRRNVIRGLQGVMDEVAKRYNVTRTVLALAWLLKHPAGIIPIVGSANPGHIRDATKADGVELEREDWYRLLEAARGSRLA